MESVRKMLTNNNNREGATCRLGMDRDNVAPPAPTPGLPRPATDETDVDVILDVEWCPHPTRRGENRVLMYGVRLDCAGRSIDLIIYPQGPERRHRLSLSTLLGRILSKAIPEILPDIPKRLTLITHYGRGDLAACRDFGRIKRQVDALGGAFTSTHGAAHMPLEFDPKSGLPDERLPRLPDRKRVRVADPSGRSQEVAVVFRDTSLLVVEDAKRSLDEIGRLVGVPKVELPEGYDKARMDLFLRDHKGLAERYLRTDLEIPALYFRRLRDLLRSIGLRDVPPTLGACAVALLKRVLDRLTDAAGNPVTVERIFATERRKAKAYSRATGRYYTTTTHEVRLARLMFDGIMAAGYHGGRTETYETGPSTAGEVLYDIDLKSAYPSAMAGIGVPDYDAAHLSTTPEDYTAAVLGVAEVEFVNPADLRFPVFGVRTDNGLVFPVRGVTVATAPEIATAIRLGVALHIRRGAIIPWSNSTIRPYEAFGRMMIDLRNQKKKREVNSRGEEVLADTLESLVVKTITNSLYGKTAQAVRPRNVFDSRSGTDRALSPSSVTNAAFAAYITGLVRAAVTEMINSVPKSRTVVSVSTDGFLSTAPIEEVDVTGPACMELAKNRRRLVGDPSLLEYKKRVLQVVTPRNRAAFTAVPIEGFKPVMARGSIKVPRGVENANDYLLGVYLDRTVDTTIPREDLIALREQWVHDSDLVSVLREPRVNLEPDHKRWLVAPRMVPITGGKHAGRGHLATSSVPHDTAEDMLEVRLLFEGWRHATGRCLKDLNDWSDWLDYLASTRAAREAGRRPHRTAGGSADDLKRQFLRALVRGEWGLDLGGRSYRAVATWLTAAGYTTSESAVKNARRGVDRAKEERRRGDAPLVAHSVAVTDATVRLLRVLLKEFPSFDYTQAFVAGHLKQVQDALRKSP